MKKNLFLPSAALIALLSLTGCAETNSNNPSINNAASISPTVTPTTNVAAPVIVTPVSQTSPTQLADKPAVKTLVPGTYCYSAKTNTLDAQATVKISSTNKINGTVQATIQNPAESYYTSYNQTLTGDLVGDKAKLKIVTKIENDTQNKQETWTITESNLNNGRESFTKVNCSDILKITYEDNATTVTKKPVRVKFNPGANSTTIKNSVIRGDRDTYLVGAKSGQQMNMKITSLENNAVFDFIAPDGKTIKTEVTNWSGKLPTNGDYRVVVGGTRGNASYELTLQIK
ncbi:hypothetical protein [Calothrix sp. UHCC 0171]|uniref:hypothetical protein n=1 Tax=Calothrix sp. UHCC 0171 TaxID=3110245 RepID=UPI002B1ED7AE|nr:hypothetical protein [Calothrix sp. UHCC 0171]MEA5572462.1 hypothetical protein [Calothrix sp. UHCC 0171]